MPRGQLAYQRQITAYSYQGQSFKHLSKDKKNTVITQAKNEKKRHEDVKRDYPHHHTSKTILH
jgi:ABC-type antimicrobial peptide transport system ATPase subunit